MNNRDVAAAFDEIADLLEFQNANPFRLRAYRNAARRIPGMGPKKAAALFKELGITSLDALKAACHADQVAALKGFGKKTQEKILAGIDLAASANERIYWAHADEIVQELLAHMREVKGIRQIEVAGSYRRGRETIGDLDL